jgi:hypothetical protein
MGMGRNWPDREDYAERHPVLAVLGWGLIIILLVAIFAGVIGLISTGSVFFEGQAAKATNPSRVQKQVYDPNNTVAQIAFFHNTCAQVRTSFAQWQTAREKVDVDTKQAESSDPIKAQQAQNALDQDMQALVGTQQNIYATANDYNSRSAQSTANVFKDSNLPARIEPPVNVGDLKNWSPPNCG